MDIPRESFAKKRKIRRAIYLVIAVIAVTAVSIAVSRLEPALPAVERSMVWTDTVKRGPMIRQVRGSGTLVTESVLWIPALTEGRVERILVLPGTEVTPDTVLLQLSNPELQLSALDAESAVHEAEAQLASLRVQLQSQLLTQRASTASAIADARQAELQVAADEQLAGDGLIADLTLQLSRVRAEEQRHRAGIEEERLEISSKSGDAQVVAQQARLRRLRATADLRQQQVEQLNVRAGAAGVLEQLPLEVGQRVTAGTNLARVSEPGRLKAEVRIAETQARDVQIGQKATIDTRNGTIPGRVSRIDPAVQNGTVTIDIALEGPLPRGARPDLSVDGTVELERLDEVLYVGRPAFGQEEGAISLFLISEDGQTCVRTRVELGRSSVTTVEIRGGLEEGDTVILSDMSTWDDHDRIRLKG